MRNLEVQLLAELIRHGQIMDTACHALPEPLLLLYLASNHISSDLAHKAIAFSSTLQRWLDSADVLDIESIAPSNEGC